MKKIKNMMILVLIIACVLLYVLVAHSEAAITIYVPSSGNDGNRGNSADAALVTLSAAYRRLENNSQIIL